MLNEMRRLGTRLAPSRGVVWVCALATLLNMGCLVTEDGDFPIEDNHPPSIASQSGADFPFDRVHVLDRSAGDGMPLDIPLEIVVTDLNLDQTLRGLVIVDNLEPAPIDVPPASEPSLHRDVEVTFNTSQLEVPGCHRVEVRVSSQFGFFSPDPVDPMDLGTAVWWFFTKSDPTQTFDPAECPVPQS